LVVLAAAAVAAVTVVAAFKRLVHATAGVRHCVHEPNDEHG